MHALHLLLALPLLLPPTDPPAVARLALPHLATSVRAGLNFDACANESDCKGNRNCVEAVTNFLCQQGQTDCWCFPPAPFDCAAAGAPPCDPGEICATNSVFNNFPFCTSEEILAANPSFTPVPNVSPPPSPSPAAPSPAPSPPPSAAPPPPATPPPSAAPPPPAAPPPSTAPPPAVASKTPAPSKQPPPAPPTPPPTKPPTPAAPPPPTTGPTTPPAPPSAPPSPSPTSVALIPSPQPPSPSPSSAATTTPQPSTPSASAASTKPGPNAAGGGLAGDPCGPGDSRCVSYRKCLEKDTLDPCTNGATCVCMGSRACSCDDDCTDGEVCSGNPNDSFCFSPTLVDSLPWATSIPCPASNATKAPAPTDDVQLNGDDCRFDTNCFGDRKCLAGAAGNCLQNDVLCDGREACDTPGDRICYCYKETLCQCSDNCRDGEVCIRLRGDNICVSPTVAKLSQWMEEVPCNNATGGPIIDVPLPETPDPEAVPTASLTPSSSLSATASASPAGGGGLMEVTTTPGSDDGGAPAPAEDPVCVDATALRHLPREELVFENHAFAKVLCDQQGSCATSGHIVSFHGQIMMMQTYCDVVGCEKQVMEVNSPRRRRRLRVPSKTNGLEYTAFAARFSTRTEEVLLKGLIRLGM